MLELAAHSQSRVSSLRAAALAHLVKLADLLDETVNLAIRTGDTTPVHRQRRMPQALRVGSREGMVFPAHRTTAGLLLLAELPEPELDEVYAAHRYAGRPGERPDLTRLRAELARVRRKRFAVNRERSERGLVAVGVLVHGADGTPQAGLSVSMPSVRYQPAQLESLVATLTAAAHRLETTLATTSVTA